MIINSDYNEVAGVNFSTLKHIFRSYNYYRYILANQGEQTYAESLGHILHEYVLEGKHYRIPELVKTKRDGTVFAKDVALVDTYTSITKLELLQNFCTDEFIVEQGFTFEYQGILFKSRIDAYHIPSKTLIDFKTNNNIQYFENDFFKYLYDMQAIMYTKALIANGYPVNHSQIYCMCTTAPYEQKMLTLDNAVLAKGLHTFDKAIDLLKRAEDTIEGTLFLPAWKMRELENAGYLDEE